MEQGLVAYKYDALKHEIYLSHYRRHFKHLSQCPVKLLELGIYKGGSLLLWKDYFENGEIIGLDLNHVEVDDPTGRIRTYQGDQTDLALLDRIAKECAPDGFDIIIDDASHLAEFTKISFWHLFDNHLKPGGCYVIEDWRVSYWEAWPDGAKYEWPNPTHAGPPQFSQRTEAKSWSLIYDGRIVGLAKKLLEAVGKDALTNAARRLYRNAKYNSRRFPSHDYGMVGLVKQLVDELGMDAITNPERNGRPPQRFPKFQRMEVCPGQVFIVKATEEDNHLMAESLRH
jgi:SAM-dependent methyltransferase